MRLFKCLNNGFFAIGQVYNERRRGRIPIPDIVMRALEMPFFLARFVVNGDG